MSYLNSVIKQFKYYKHLGEKAMGQIGDDALFWQGGEGTNSIAVIVGHLAGNMRSRWTDFLTTDGEKEWRQRDREFEPVISSREELEMYWTAGWKCVFDTLATLDESHLEQIIYIRNQGHTVTEALNRQMMHCAYHIGQIVYVAKMMAGEEWISLSIPRNASQQYNAEKFSTEKSRSHFTDEFVDEK